MMDELPQVVDPSLLTDADWAELNKLRKAYEAGGKSALYKAYRELGSNPVQYVRVMSAFCPSEVRASIREAIAKRGLTGQDILQAVRKRESTPRDQ
jgi:hypothetical protein